MVSACGTGIGFERRQGAALAGLAFGAKFFLTQML
jgi:hypothetical protein